MPIESRHPCNPLRALLVGCVTLLGLVAIVGSGGGSLGFVPCTDTTICNDNEPPPVPSAAVDPPYYTALVGSPASFTVQTANLSGSLTYQWRRSTDGGASYVDIAGATTPRYEVAGVNLADDKTVFRVDVRSNGAVALQPVARLAVSAVPGVVFQDEAFLAEDWLASPVPADTGALPMHLDESLATGGHPDAFRRMTFQVPAGTGTARVIYSSLASTYDPATQGAVYVIDYAEDCVALQTSTTLSTESSLVIEQGGRRFLANLSGVCNATAWSTVFERASLAPGDFRRFDGPACGTGEACPDFSTTAASMRFGYWRIAYGTPGSVIAHGIDNWKVTVWKR